MNSAFHILLLIYVSMAACFSQQLVQAQAQGQDQGQETAPPSFALTLNNGSSFVCKLADLGEKVGFISALSQDPIEFDFDQIYSMTPLQQAEQAQNTAELTALLPSREGLMILNNGDYILGSLVSLDDKSMEINSALGKLNIPIREVRQIFFQDQSNLLYSYDLLQESNLWVRGTEAQQEDGFLKFERQSQVMLPLQLPSSYQLELESPMPLSELGLSFVFHVNARGDSNSLSYFLQLNPGGTLTLSASGNGGFGNQFNRGMSSLEEEKNLLLDAEADEPGSRIVISVDRTTGTLVLRANNGLPISFEGLIQIQDELIMDDILDLMNNPNRRNLNNQLVRNPDYSYLLMNPLSSSFTLSKLRVWEQEAGSSAPMGFVSDVARKMNRGGDRQSYLYLNNGDALFGQLTGLNEENYLVRVQGVEIPVPKSKVTEINFPQKENFAGRDEAVQDKLFRVRLRDGGQISVSLKQLTMEGILAASSSIGEDFNIPLSECLLVERMNRNNSAGQNPDEQASPRSLSSLPQLLKNQNRKSRQFEYLGLPETR